jgi:hypothetical protein
LDIDQDLIEHQNTRTFESLPFGGKSAIDKAESAKVRDEYTRVRRVHQRLARQYHIGGPIWYLGDKGIVRDINRVTGLVIMTLDKNGRTIQDTAEQFDSRPGMTEALAGKSEEDKAETEREQLMQAVKELKAEISDDVANKIPEELYPELLVLMQTVYGGQPYINAKGIIHRFMLGAARKEEQNALIIQRFLARHKVDMKPYKYVPERDFGYSGYSGYSAISYLPGREIRHHMQEAHRIYEALMGKSAEDKEETANRKKSVFVFTSKGAWRRYEDNLEKGRPALTGISGEDLPVVNSFRTWDEVDAFVSGIVDVDGWMYYNEVHTKSRREVKMIFGLHRTGKTVHKFDTEDEANAYRMAVYNFFGRYDLYAVSRHEPEYWSDELDSLVEALAGKTPEDKEATSVQIEKERRAKEQEEKARKLQFSREWKKRMDTVFGELDADVIDSDGNGDIPLSVSYGEGTLKIRNGRVDEVDVKIDTEEVKSDLLHKEDKLTDEWQDYWQENEPRPRQLGKSGKMDHDEIFAEWLKEKKFHDDDHGYTGNWEDWRGDAFSYWRFRENYEDYIMIDDEIFSGDTDDFLAMQSESYESLFDGSLNYQWGMDQFEEDLQKWLLFKGRNLEGIEKDELISMIHERTPKYYGRSEELEQMSDDDLRELYTKIMTDTGEPESQMKLNLERKEGVLA